jgi:hypothetical protein
MQQSVLSLWKALLTNVLTVRACQYLLLPLCMQALPWDLALRASWKSPDDAHIIGEESVSVYLQSSLMH